MNEFLKSSQVRLFPTAYRKAVATTAPDGTTTNVVYDPESKLNTEFNLTSMASRASDHSSFVLDYNDTTGVMHVSMCGYWFELTAINRDAGKPVWAEICVKDVNASNDNTEMSLPTLYSMKDGVSTLENLDDGDGSFYGIRLTSSKPSDKTGYYKLQLLDESGSVPASSLLRVSTAVISDAANPCDAEKPISAEFTSGAIKTSSLVALDTLKASGSMKLAGNVEINDDVVDDAKFTIGGGTNEIKGQTTFSGDGGSEVHLEAATTVGKSLTVNGSFDYAGINSTTTTDLGLYYLWGSAIGTGKGDSGIPKIITGAGVNNTNGVTTLFAPHVSAMNYITSGQSIMLPNAQGTSVNAAKITPQCVGMYHTANSSLNAFTDYDACSSLTYTGLRSYGSSGAVELYSSKSSTSPIIKLTAATGVVTAASFNATSDRRLKDNLTPLKPVDGILDLPLYEYDYKETGEHSIGCMAQDLREIAPSLVDEDDDGYLSIKESKLTYYLLLEVRALRDEVKALKEKAER